MGTIPAMYLEFNNQTSSNTQNLEIKQIQAVHKPTQTNQSKFNSNQFPTSPDAHLDFKNEQDVHKPTQTKQLKLNSNISSTNPDAHLAFKNNQAVTRLTQIISKQKTSPDAHLAFKNNQAVTRLTQTIPKQKTNPDVPQNLVFKSDQAVASPTQINKAQSTSNQTSLDAPKLAFKEIQVARPTHINTNFIPTSPDAQLVSKYNQAVTSSTQTTEFPADSTQMSQHTQNPNLNSNYNHAITPSPKAPNLILKSNTSKLSSDTHKPHSTPKPTYVDQSNLLRQIIQNFFKIQTNQNLSQPVSKANRSIVAPTNSIQTKDKLTSHQISTNHNITNGTSKSEPNAVRPTSPSNLHSKQLSMTQSNNTQPNLNKNETKFTNPTPSPRLSLIENTIPEILVQIHQNPTPKIKNRKTPRVKFKPSNPCKHSTTTKHAKGTHKPTIF